MKVKAGVNINDYKKLKAGNFESEIGEIYGRINDRVYYEEE